jgi:hypothetical protein
VKPVKAGFAGQWLNLMEANMENTFNGIDIGLNVAVMTIARRLFPSGYRVSENAPDTLDKLTAAFNAHDYVIYSGHSDQTIFGDEEHNWAFRAWHDWHHWRGQLAFDPVGEAEACRRQCADLVAVYGDSVKTQFWCAVLNAEINGQLQYAERHGGEFPTDQKAFVSAYLNTPQCAVVDTY